MIRKMLHAVSYVVIFLMKPFKVYAYRTRFPIIRGLIIEVTALVDFLLIFLNIQNNTMLMHEKVYNGNFIFGKGIALTDYDTIATDIQKPAYKCNHFMALSIISTDSSVFAINAGSLNQCPPLRGWTRKSMEDNVFTGDLLTHDYESLHALNREILEEWGEHPKMAKVFPLRGASTRIFLKILSGTTVSSEDAEAATFQYIRRFGELSLFNRVPFVNGILGSHKGIRKDAYFMLKEKYDLDMMVIDMTLFAAMFSVGTLVIRCVEDIQSFAIPYKDLDYQMKRNFIFEAVRLWPTVTSVHRIVERDENVRIGKKDITLTAGDEVIYPFACGNRNAERFHEPAKMNLERPQEEYANVLSWSKGPHDCPGKELSIIVTILMLDQLSKRYDLSKLKIFNPTF